jgi:linoleoyl-CoA desaturase
MSDFLPNTMSGQVGATVPMLEFGGDRSFEMELRRRVNEYFERTAQPQTGDRRMYLKSALLGAAFVTSYLLLVFAANNLWQGLLFAVLLAATTAALGFNIPHDSSHNGYSASPLINKITVRTLDLIGGSSYIWHFQHVLIHHRYVNITGYDVDADLGVLGRVTPHQKRLFFHRWQHYYLWPLYGLLAVKWQLFDDFSTVIRGRLGNHRVPRPRGWDLAFLAAGKIIFFSWALVIPLQFHPLGAVIFFYLFTDFCLGLFVSMVFQLPHLVEGSEFPMPSKESGCMENAWAVHQASVTVGHSHRSRVITYLLGGLNFHIEHHLFPTICHVHYPAISDIVQKTCREFGVKYQENRTLAASLASHYRWLRRMGNESVEA